MKKTARYAITVKPAALAQLAKLRKADAAKILTAAQSRLSTEPTTPTKAIKRITHDDGTSVWQLRVGDYRVWYDVDGASVVIREVFFKGTQTTDNARGK